MPFDKKITPFADGVQITVPGFDLVVPELTLAALQKFQPRLTIMSDKDVAESVKYDLMYEVVHAALQRHYPEATLDDVREKFSLSNVAKAFKSALKYRSDDAGEDVAGPLPGTARVDPRSA